MRYLLLTLLLIFSSVVVKAEPTVITPTRNMVNTEIRVTVIWVNPNQMVSKYKRLTGKDAVNPDTFAAFYTYNKITRECKIYSRPVIFLEDSDTVELLGHELLHCVYGEFHGSDVMSL